MTLLKARPTTYNGIKMRSRLEARVAAFLDELGFEWEYEPGAFAKGRLQYLPDFRLKHWDTRNVYLEVRGEVDDIDKLNRVYKQMEIILASEPDAILIWGDADAFEHGQVEWRHPVVGRWQSVLIAEIALVLGKGVCEHYRMPEYGS